MGFTNFDHIKFFYRCMWGPLQCGGPGRPPVPPSGKYGPDLDIVTINVGGHIFQIFEDVLSSLPHTKLASCLIDHKNVGVPFFEEELGFWGAFQLA